nr:TRAP transporter small permease [Dissulfurirhabdus thermomarina]
MVALAGLQIVLRELFGSGLAWSGPLLRILVLWVGMAGAMVAARDDDHIRISALRRFLPDRWRPGIEAASDLVTALVAGVVAAQAARFAYMDWSYGTEAMPGVPAWACEAILPLAFGVIALRYLAFAWTRAAEWLGRKRP